MLQPASMVRIAQVWQSQCEQLMQEIARAELPYTMYYSTLNLMDPTLLADHTITENLPWLAKYQQVLRQAGAELIAAMIGTASPVEVVLAAANAADTAGRKAAEVSYREGLAAGLRSAGIEVPKEDA